MHTITERLEVLISERAALIERYAPLWAAHGGGSQSWEQKLLDIKTASVKAEHREQLASQKSATETELKEALHADPRYQAEVRRAAEARTEWARIQQEMKTLDLRIQLEMAKLRFALGNDESPTTLDPDGEDA